MAERDSFMPGACTTAANREVFKCLDAGRRNEAVIHAAQQVCMTTCVQFNACEAQSDVITLELQKSGVEATVVAGKYVQPFSLSQDILASTEMFKAPVVTWEKGSLPESPDRALSTLRLASRAGQLGRRVTHWNIKVASPLADMEMALRDTVHLSGLAEKEAEHAALWIVRMYAEYMDMQEKPTFSIEEKKQILGIAGIFARDVRRLQDLNFGTPTKLAAYLSADYCEWLWGKYSERWNITPGKFRSLLLRKPAKSVEILDEYIDSRPRAQQTPKEARLHLGDNAQAPRRKRASAAEIEKARTALGVFAESEYFTPGLLKELSGHGPRAMQEAEAYLDRIKETQLQMAKQQINVPVSLLREAVYRSASPLTDRETLESIAEVHRLKMLYRSDENIRPWMATRVVETYGTNRQLILERVRYLIRWGFAKETQDLYEAGSHSWQCASPKSPRALIPTQKFFEMQPGEQACLIHAFDLGPFLGEQPMGLTDISQRWNIEDPAATALLLAPFIDAPPDTSGQGVAAHWARYRHKALRGYDVAQHIAAIDDAYFALLYAQIVWRDPRVIQQYRFVESEAFKRGARRAIGYMNSSCTENKNTLQAYAARIRHPLREAERLVDLSITEEERYIYALCYGAEHFRRLVAYGSDHLLQRMREQAYAILGESGAPKEPISFREVITPPPVSPAPRQRMVAPLAPLKIRPKAEPRVKGTTRQRTTPQPVLKPITRPRPAFVPKREPKPESEPKTPVQPEPVPRKLPVKEVPRKIEHVAERPRTYESIHDLPDPERAAVYIAHAAMTHFTFTMRKQRWHDPQKVWEHFGFTTHAELVAHVRSNILPLVRKSQHRR